MFKKAFFPFSFLSIFFLTGCSTLSDNTLNITPQIALPSQDPSLMGITVSINGVDRRQDAALAKVNQEGKLIALTPSRDLRFLLQEALEKQMVARGYMIGPSGAADLKVLVNTLYADVRQGDLRHHIVTRADISIIVQAKNANSFTKNYRATYEVKGALMATNAKITDAVNTALTDVISDMAEDISVSNFIKQNAR